MVVSFVVFLSLFGNQGCALPFRSEIPFAVTPLPYRFVVTHSMDMCYNEGVRQKRDCQKENMEAKHGRNVLQRSGKIEERQKKRLEKRLEEAKLGWELHDVCVLQRIGKEGGG